MVYIDDGCEVFPRSITLISQCIFFLNNSFFAISWEQVSCFLMDVSVFLFRHHFPSSDVGINTLVVLGFIIIIIIIIFIYLLRFK
jgi:hypothetical protein